MSAFESKQEKLLREEKERVIATWESIIASQKRHHKFMWGLFFFQIILLGAITFQRFF